VAGIAALWLARHGRDELLKKYQHVPLYLVFREVLRAACDAPPEDDRGEFGAGIVNAARTLTAELPDENELIADLLETPFAEAPPEAAPTELDYFNTIFDTLPKAEVRQRLAVLLNVPEAELEARLRLLNAEELAFYLMTDPDLREFFTGWDLVEAELAETSGLESVVIVPDTQIRGQALHEKLMNAPLSDELRTQLTIVSE
jgi:hypothetical protein